MLEESAGGWRIARDGYDDRVGYAASPDFDPLSWSAAGGPGPSDSTLPGPLVHAAPLAPANTCLYDFQAAVNYAHSWALGRNNGYCYFCSCGGDCANFVSQCWSAGNEHWDGTWFCNQNWVCGCSGSTYSGWYGSAAWVGVPSQHAWITGTGRGGDVGSQNDLGLGDMINYDWIVASTGQTDGDWDHCSIVTKFDQYGNPLISCHCNDKEDYVWWDGGAPGTNYRFTEVYSGYNC